MPVGPVFDRVATHLTRIARRGAPRSGEVGEELVHDCPERLALAVGVVDEVVGADLVRSAGGEVKVLSLVEDCSTSAIIDRLSD